MKLLAPLTALVILVIAVLSLNCSDGSRQPASTDTGTSLTGTAVDRQPSATAPPSQGSCTPATSAEPARSQLHVFQPSSYHRIDPTADPAGGTPVYIVDPSMVVHAQVPSGVKRLDVQLTLGASLVISSASAEADAAGNVDVPLQLPERGVVYVVQTVAMYTSGCDAPSVVSGASRVKAE